MDREQGLGAMPLGTGSVSPPRRLRGRRKERRTTGPVLPGLLISGVIAAMVMLHDPGMTGYRFRQVVDHLTGADAGSYAFVLTTPQGDPVGWDHCDPIDYVVNPEGAPDDWEDTVDDAIGRVQDASGFEFAYGGTSEDRELDGRVADPDNPPPVLIAWADADEVPELAGSTAGIAGSTPDGLGNGVRYISGTVVLDTEAYDRMDQQNDDLGQRLILAHELGHVLGLDHVDDTDELMNPKYVGQTDFGVGDRKGLEQLHDLPC